MGMFDTIHVASPLVCPVCGRRERTHQTDAFEDVMKVLSAEDPLAAIIGRNKPGPGDEMPDDPLG